MRTESGLDVDTSSVILRMMFQFKILRYFVFFWDATPEMNTMACSLGIHLISAISIPLGFGILWPMSHFSYDAEFKRQNFEACSEKGLFRLRFQNLA